MSRSNSKRTEVILKATNHILNKPLLPPARMDYEKRIIWQPLNLYQNNHDLDIILNQDFALEMLNTKLDFKKRMKILQLGEDITKRYKNN